MKEAIEDTRSCDHQDSWRLAYGDSIYCEKCQMVVYKYVDTCDHRFSVVVEWQTGRHVDITDRDKLIKELDDFFEDHYKGSFGKCSYSPSCSCFMKIWVRKDLVAADKNGWIMDKEGTKNKATKLACEKCGEVKELP